MVGPVTLAEIHSYGLVGDISSDEMGRRREEIAAAPHLEGGVLLDGSAGAGEAGVHDREFSSAVRL